MTTASPPDVFNGSAASYDAAFESLPGTPRLRRILHGYMLRVFQPGGHILELNAGTGTDAVFLASHGIHVHATDGSAAMVREIDEKVKSRGLDHLVTTGVLDLSGIGSLRAGPFDGVLSNLGGINCLPDPGPLLNALPLLLRPGAHALLCFMPDMSLWETAAFAVRGQWKNARRRRNTAGCVAQIDGGRVRTYYHSPVTLARSSLPGLTHRATIGLNIITPPPSSASAHAILRPLLPVLERLEDLLAPHPPLNRMGDHVLVILRRAS
jgi:SAM-dependent methyltransferase